MMLYMIIIEEVGNEVEAEWTSTGAWPCWKRVRIVAATVLLLGKGKRARRVQDSCAPPNDVIR